MSLKLQIQTDLLQAMKARDAVKLGALRMVKAAIMKWEVEGSKREAQDEDVQTILKREIKQRKEAAEQYRVGNRPELAEKEEKEATILSTYLPEQLSEVRLKEIALAVKEKVGAGGPSDFGKVMGLVMAQVKGQADGGVVQKIVKEILT